MTKRFLIILVMLFWCDVAFAGCIEGNCKNGQGTYVYKDGKYVGGWTKGKRDGQGTYTRANGDKYVGEWKKNKYHGQGTYTRANGGKYVGGFSKNKFHGKGTLTHADGKKFVGHFRSHSKHGVGIMTYADGTKYNGYYKSNKRHGQGTMTYADGRKYVGKWEKGKVYKSEEEIEEDKAIVKAQSVCKKIGFTPGTDKFTDCTLKMLTQGQGQDQTVIVGQRRSGRVYPLHCRQMGGASDC